ncbi:MAG: tRNA (adenosine(37)-N6)-threonylcarbamoyltransferase complex dimerization subunit type 1 TsaB [Eubacteriales bacterium]|nr:tRNA (adenosine(37)-N6)-threonylcarbamoyltransferase complex dimerization subunit type 1 TsaB [Eubacteriales bacterium]
MKLLAVDSSGRPSSVAYLEDSVVKAEYTTSDNLNHSVTLMPNLKKLMDECCFGMGDLDCVAVAAGPGSFTGLRIGIATVKGLTMADDIPVVKVSSLKGLAQNIGSGFVCPIMDARRGQVYGAALRDMEYVIEDSALTITDFLALVSENLGDGEKAVFLGDGVPVHKELILETLGERAEFAHDELLLQKASSIAVLGEKLFNEGKITKSDDVVPEYLRIPLAEQEKKEGILEDAGVHSLKKIAKGNRK